MPCLTRLEPVAKSLRSSSHFCLLPSPTFGGEAAIPTVIKTLRPFLRISLLLLRPASPFTMSTCAAPALPPFLHEAMRKVTRVPLSTVLYVLLTDHTTYSTLLAAVGTAAYASYRANMSLFKTREGSPHRPHPSLSDQLIDENTRVLGASMAMALPVIATCSIVFLFFFLTSIGSILTALSCVSSFFSVAFVLWPFAEALARRLRSLPCVPHTDGAVEMFLVTPVATVVVGLWLFTGHWVLNNVIAIALCITFASLCKVQSLKVSSTLFGGLFLYDIFFVFISQRFFGKNVMVEVATSTPVNPASAVADFLHLPVDPVRTLALPAKLIFPGSDGHHSLLGLGDIILPEVFLVFLLEVDLRNRTIPLYKGYFARALVAYAFGLVASFFCSFMFQAAQPALLYIVPALLIPTILLARRRGQLRQLWLGVTKREDGVSVGGEGPNRSSDASGGLEGKDEESSALLA